MTAAPAPDSPVAVALAKALLHTDQVDKDLAAIADALDANPEFPVFGLMRLATTSVDINSARGAFMAMFVWTQPDLKALTLEAARSGKKPEETMPGILLRAELVSRVGTPAPDTAEGAE